MSSLLFTDPDTNPSNEKRRQNQQPISIDAWGNIQIRGKFDIAKDNKGAYPLWLKGRVVIDDLKSNDFSNVLTKQPQYITYPNPGMALLLDGFSNPPALINYV